MKRALLLMTKAQEDPDPQAGTTLYLASFEAEDRADDVVSRKWDIAEWLDNPVILADHDRTLVIGRGVEGEVREDGLRIRVKWDTENPDPKIAGLAHQGLTGFRGAVSVSFPRGKAIKRSKLPEDHKWYKAAYMRESPWGGEYEYSGMYYENPLLLELSSVAVPMLAGALAVKDEEQRAAKEFEEKVMAILHSGVVRDTVLQALKSSEAKALITKLAAPIAATEPAEPRTFKQFLEGQNAD